MTRLSKRSVDAFASDGVEYAAWQVGPHKPIVVLNTRSGKRRENAPHGCELQQQANGGGTEGTGAAGRFLLFCKKGEALLDARTGKTVKLPAVEPDGAEYNWFSVGTRYVVGREVVYEIASGKVIEFAHASERADPNAPGASMNALCPTVRSLAERYQPVIPERAFAYTRSLFARQLGEHGNAQLDRCHGNPKILRTGRDESYAKDFDLRGGVLSWDTGLEESRSAKVYRGSLYAYGLASHKRHRWALPITPGVQEEYASERGTFGYSTHTANTVFWLADADTSEGRASKVDRWIIFSARR